MLFQNDIEEVFSFKTLPDFATQENQDIILFDSKSDKEEISGIK